MLTEEQRAEHAKIARRKYIQGRKLWYVHMSPEEYKVVEDLRSRAQLTRKEYLLAAAGWKLKDK